MDKLVRFSHVDQVQVDEREFMRLLWLAGPDIGSERASLALATVENGYDSVVGPIGFDEILYLMKGSAEVEIEGIRRSLGPGSVVFIPQGVIYRWKVIDAPNEFIVVTAPPESQAMKTPQLSLADK